jgi:hypothetical protein
MCGLVVSPKFLKQMCVGLSAHPTLFLRALDVESEAVVAPGAYIRFLIE